MVSLLQALQLFNIAVCAKRARGEIPDQAERGWPGFGA
jgi:hypothetical protein